MKKSERTLTAVVLSFGMMLAWSHFAAAATLLNTINDLFCGQCGWGLANDPTNGNVESLGIQFTSASSTTITNVEAYIGGTGSIQLGIMADNGGLPFGTYISGESTSVTLNASTDVNLSSVNWSISAGTYWLVGIADLGTSAGWQYYGPQSNNWAYQQTGSWALPPAFNLADPPEARITSADVSATPLPPALPLFVTGLGGLGLLDWRRKRKAQAAA